jgi:hypothetical protein
VAQEALQKPKAEKKVRRTDQRYKDADSRKHLVGIRVVQRNLVYITGLSPRVADENVCLRRSSRSSQQSASDKEMQYAEIDNVRCASVFLALFHIWR